MITKTKDQVADRYNSLVTTVQHRRDLSPEGRQAHLAKALLEARDEMRAIERTEQDELQTRRTELLKLLFGNPRNDASSVISYRDALDRAEQIKNPAEATTLLERAELTGDDLLARAIGMRAASRGELGGGWAQVLDTWAQTHPGATDALQELEEMDRANTTTNRFMRNMRSTLAVPRELSGKTADSQLHSLARSLQ